MTGRILITGASGKTGAAIARKLRAEGAVVRLASRTGNPVAGAETVRFDWNDPATFRPTVTGVERLYLLAPVGDNAPLDTVAPFIDEALRAGVRRFVLLSSSLLDEGDPAMGQIHAHLRHVAPEWVVLRPSWFMENFIFPPHLSTIRDEGVIYSATSAGRVPFVAVDDIAAVAAQALRQATPPEHDLLITGPDLLNYDEVARLIGQARGHPVRHIGLSAAALTARHTALGLPPTYAAMLAGLDDLIAKGAEERLSDVVPRLTGRPATPFEVFASNHGNRWSAAPTGTYCPPR